MDDPSEQLRRHYAAQSLPPEATERILAAAQAAKKKRPPLWFALFAAAAAVALVVGGYSYGKYVQRVDVVQIEDAVQAFFSQPTYQLDQASANRDALRNWLVDHGAPAEAEIPPGLAQLPSVGCKTLAVGRQYAYVLCFQTSAAGEKAMPGKVSASMMKGKTQTLVHLVIVKTSALHEGKTDIPFHTDTRNGWTFAKSEHGGITYLVATTLDVQQLEAILREA